VVHRFTGRTVRVMTVGALPAALIAIATGMGPATAAPTQLNVWCSLKLGDSKASVISAMGAPNGHQADDWLSGMPDLGLSYAEWDTGTDILLATFDKDDHVTNLQAYAGMIGPKGATDIGCPAFRNQ